MAVWVCRCCASAVNMLGACARGCEHRELMLWPILHCATARPACVSCCSEPVSFLAVPCLL